MTDKTTAINKKTFEKDLNQTLSNLRDSFTPQEWSKKEREQMMKELIEAEDLAKKILARNKK